MKPEIDYKTINRESWNNRTDVHFDSDFYDNKSFLEGRNSLNEIELALLGNVQGKKILHLQCHFGQDSISLSRMGATVTGVDLSDRGIERARELAQKAGEDVTFICCDIYDLPQHLEQQFDLVFTSYGVIGWLPDMDRWAGLIKHFLKPTGRLVMAEFHPVVWMYDDDFTKIKFSYFKDEAIVESEAGTYADTEAPIEQQYVCWNHGMSEVVTALLQQGFALKQLQEFDYSPYNCFNNTVEIAPNKYQIKGFEGKMPMVYALELECR